MKGHDLQVLGTFFSSSYVTWNNYSVIVLHRDFCKRQSPLCVKSSSEQYLRAVLSICGSSHMYTLRMSVVVVSTNCCVRV